MTKTVFIVMPSDEFRQSIDKRVTILECALENGWSVKLPKYNREAPTFDLNSTLATLREVDLILVDLSEERPSCYFELGLAEASGSEVAAMALKNTPIHQTSLREVVHFFSDIDEFRELVVQILKRQE